jgi:ABC-2 type transport system ATP-binding protein
MLEVKDICKSYGKKEVLKNINLKVEKGEIVCLLGKNGAGKTSLLNIISSIHPMNSGDVFINGFNIFNEPEKAKSHLGYVADNTDIYDYLTGAEFLKLVTDIYKVKDSGEIIKKYVGLFDLEVDINKLISTYSLGMKRKIMIISCLIHDPDVIIMDEPSNGLDIDVRPVLFDELKRLAKTKAVLISTHEESVVGDFCDRVAVIRDGEIKASETILRLKKKYPKNCVAEFFKEVHRL